MKFALCSSYENTGYGEMGSTEFIIATFDKKKDAKKYLDALPGESCHRHIKKYTPPPHNPSPHVPKTKKEKRAEKIQELEKELERLKGKL